MRKLYLAPYVYVLLAGCVAGGGAGAGRARVSVFDVAEAFGRDLAGLELRVVTRDDLDPARAAGPADAMDETLRLTASYLDRGSGTRANRELVRCLRACALLARGDPGAARESVAGIHARRGQLLSRENRVVAATVYAVGAARSVEARQALERLFEGVLDPEEFAVRYGSFVAIDLPDPADPGYRDALDAAVLSLVETCFDSNEREDHRAELRRLAGEQVYNEAAALLSKLPPPSPGPLAAVERWLAAVALNLLAVHAYLMPDLLPVPLDDLQKQWQREQIQPVYEHGKRIAAHLLPAAERAALRPVSRPRKTPTQREFARHLYERLLDSEIVVLGWIATR